MKCKSYEEVETIYPIRDRDLFGFCLGQSDLLAGRLAPAIFPFLRLSGAACPFYNQHHAVFNVRRVFRTQSYGYCE